MTFYKPSASIAMATMPLVHGSKPACLANREHFDNKNEMCMDFLESLFPNKALNDDEEHESNLAQTLEAKYQKVDVKEVAQNQKHLTIKRRKQFAALLSDCNKLFSGELGLCPHRKTAPRTN
jgi:hypothetical protein